MKNILLLIALFGFAVMISCSSQLARKTARPVEAPAVVFEKKSPDTLPPVLRVSTEIAPPDTVYKHTETIREVLDTAALNTWLEQNREMLTEVRELESQVIGKLILDYNTSLDQNEELIKRYFEVQEEKEAAESTLAKTQNVQFDIPAYMWVLNCIMWALVILKYRFSRKKITSEIRSLRSCRTNDEGQ